jgi:hypothetical protein
MAVEFAWEVMWTAFLASLLVWWARSVLDNGYLWLVPLVLFFFVLRRRWPSLLGGVLTLLAAAYTRDGEGVQ